MLEPTASSPLYLDQGSGSPVVLVHGSLCDYRYWRWQSSDLARVHRIIAPSLAGYWPTLELSKFDARLQAQLLLQQLDSALGTDSQFHIVGHSRGAVVTLLLAELAPKRLLSLTLADPGLVQSEDAPAASYLRDACNLIEQGQIDAGLALFVDAVNGDGTWRQMVRWFREMVHDNAPTLLPQSTEQRYLVNLPMLAKTLRCPVLFMGGQHSPPRYAECIQQLLQSFPHAYEVTIAHAAHGMNLANPKAFNHSLLRFLQAVDNQTARTAITE
ncbi:alpha/beta fold hydrolase [Paenalcaligenes sp. Me52]|uniref:alpha/beta fold hydrolase n=1 Tax=Paenalcaligenes sp. Me52 TaxID=3392038 RepID=UPI003D2A95B1